MFAESYQIYDPPATKGLMIHAPVSIQAAGENADTGPSGTGNVYTQGESS